MRLETFGCKVVLVTGGSRGLGRALGERLAGLGARVVLVAREASALEEVVGGIRAAGGQAWGIAADVGDKQAVHAIAGEAAALAGPVDVAILNASTLGPTRPGPTPLPLLLDTECEDFQRVLEVNLLGPFRLAKVLAGSMLLRGGGTVLTISSDAAVEAYPRWGAYSVSKAGLDHLSRIFAAELEGTGVRFLAVDPGEMDTRMHAAAIPDADPSTLARPADVAARIVDMLGDLERAPSGSRLEASAWVASASPARAPRDRSEGVRLLFVDSRDGSRRDGELGDLVEAFEDGDLLVVNDAATLPGSLFARTLAGEAVEVRLVTRLETGHWQAVLFGAGDWRERTEDRAAPPLLASGERLAFGAQERPRLVESPAARALELGAQVVAVSPDSSRLIELRFDLEGGELWSAIYRLGRPVQYSHLHEALPLWSAQTVYAGRPWAAEMPSAGRPLSWSLLLELRRRGVRVVALTHAAGLSATGDPALDAALPLPERYELPRSTLEAIEATRASGGRVIAVGTTVVRALEGCAAQHGRLIAGAGTTDLVIDADFELQVVHGLLTGIHEPSESHYRLLQAFAPEASLRDAWHHAVAEGYLVHEFGDLSLIAPSAVRSA